MRKIIIAVASIALLIISNVYTFSEVEAESAVGKSFAEVFPDPVFAQAVVDELQYFYDVESVDDFITQEMIDEVVTLGGYSNISTDITDITGIEIFINLEFIFDIAETSVTSLPENFGNLSNLQEFSCSSMFSNCLLTSLPESFGNLSSLEWLTIMGDTNWGGESVPLTSLPESFGNLTNLTRIYMERTLLTSLPESIGNLSNLEDLMLKNNELASLPESIGNLSSLRLLWLHENQLVSLPESIGNLSNLESFLVDYNQLTSLPENIANLNYLGQYDYTFSYNLLPEDFYYTLETLGFDVDDQNSFEQDQLRLIDDSLSFDILSQTSLDNIDYESLLMIDQSAPLLDTLPLSPAHTFILDNYVDENNQPVELSDYIQNGVVIKEGKVYVSVRATGTGLFPNTSDRALTPETLELNFRMVNHDLSFDLNGATGQAPETQSIQIGLKATEPQTPTRDGYTFLNWNTSADGSGMAWDFSSETMPDEDVILYAQWLEDDEVPLSMGTVLVEYLDEDRNTIAPAVTLTGEVGTAYASEKKEIEGFTFVRVEGEAEGVFTEEDITVSYIYQQDDEALVTTGTVLVEYLDEDRNTIAPAMTLTGEVGTTYTTEQKEIEGFTFVRVEGEKEGIFTEDAISVIYIYTKDIVDPIDPTDPEEPDTGLPNTGLSNPVISGAVLIVTLGTAFYVIGARRKELN